MKEAHRTAVNISVMQYTMHDNRSFYFDSMKKVSTTGKWNRTKKFGKRYA